MEVIGVGPSGRSLKKLNNKNNLADLYLKKRLDQYHREKTFSLSHMDRDKFDTRDFLTRIKTIESDNNQAAIQYLGRKPAKHLRRSKTFVHKSTPQTYPLYSKDLFRGGSVEDQPQDEEIKPSTVPTALGFHREFPTPPPVKQSRSMPPLASPSPEENLVTNVDSLPELSLPKEKEKIEPRHSTTLPSVTRRGSVYLQIAAVADNPSDFDVSSEEADENINKPAKVSTRRKSFIAWVNDKRSSTDGLLPSFLKDQLKTPVEKRRNSFMNWLKRREEVGKKEKRTETSLDGIYEDNDTDVHDTNKSIPMTSRSDLNASNTTSGLNKFKQAGDVMRTIVYMKARKRDPLNIRLKKFYEKIDALRINGE